MYVFILSIVALISVSVLSNAMFVRRGIATPFTVALKFVPILFLAAGGYFYFCNGLFAGRFTRIYFILGVCYAIFSGSYCGGLH